MRFMPVKFFVFLAMTAAIPALAEEAAQDSEAEKIRKTTETIAKALENIAPEGWTATGEVERYTPINLFDKINGRSELFMSYGVVGMTFVGLAPPESDGTRYLDVFLYDMAEPLNAFGVYSAEKWPDNPKADVGRAGNWSNTDLMYWHGQYYVTLSASDAEPAMKEAQLAVANTLTKRLKDNGETLWFWKVLPEKHLQRDSVQYFRVDALGYEFLTNTVTADYELEAGEATVFVSRQESAEKAASVREQFVKAMTRYGDNPATIELDGTSADAADMGGGFHDAVFVSGSTVAGVTATESLPVVKAALAMIEAAVKE